MKPSEIALTTAIVVVYSASAIIAWVVVARWIIKRTEGTP